jgi:gamma-glutamyl-gamma-aminobutyrate hydrolase PuuD
MTMKTGGTPLTSPLIGISSYSLRARWSTWDDQADLLPHRYVEMVAQAGGLPVLLPPTERVADVLPRIDGLILSGGSDVEPSRYGAKPHPAAGPFFPARDAAELELCRRALAGRLPVLGICRGLQIINVALGGTLHQHLPDVVGNDSHSPEEHGYGTHKVSVAAGSLLAAALGGSEAAVPTHHHQAVDRLGTGLVATAWTDDGIVEAAELAPFDSAQADSAPADSARADSARADSAGSAPAPFMVAVQWHPEVGEDPSLFRALVAAAGQRK